MKKATEMLDAAIINTQIHYLEERARSEEDVAELSNILVTAIELAGQAFALHARSPSEAQIHDVDLRRAQRLLTEVAAYARNPTGDGLFLLMEALQREVARTLTAAKDLAPPLAANASACLSQIERAFGR